MKLTGCVPILNTASVEQSLAFYKDALGFVEIRTRKNQDELEWVYLKSGEVYLMLQLTSQPIRPDSESIQLYFYIDDIDSLHHYLSAKQFRVSALETTSYQMKQCVLLDPDGYKIQIGETLRK